MHERRVNDDGKLEEDGRESQNTAAGDWVKLWCRCRIFFLFTASVPALQPVAVAVGNGNVQGTPLLFSYPSFELDWAVYDARSRSRPGGKRASVRPCVNASVHVPGRSHDH